MPNSAEMNRPRLRWILLAMSLIIIISIFRLSDLRSSIYLLNKNIVKEEVDFDRTIMRLNWPIFIGADHYQTTEKTSQPDPLLLSKILNSMKMMKTPVFRIKGADDGWKFPRIFHQSWISEEIPAMTAKWVKRWLEIHPDWTYIFWTDKSARDFIKDYYPSLLAHYDSWQLPVQRADMFRYIAIYAFGGVWGDMDMEPLKSLDPIRDWSSCVLSREPDLQTFVMSNHMNNYANNYTFTCNAFFACRAQHPFMFYMISRTIAKSPLVRERQCHLSEVIQCTGPWLMSWVYAYYRRSISQQYRDQHPEYDVICPEYEYFLPTFDETRRTIVMDVCRGGRLQPKQAEACQVFKDREEKNLPVDYSYTTHHWFHSYHYNVAKSTVDISSVTRTTSPDDSIFQISYE